MISIGTRVLARMPSCLAVAHFLNGYFASSRSVGTVTARRERTRSNDTFSRGRWDGMDDD